MEKVEKKEQKVVNIDELVEKALEEQFIKFEFRNGTSLYTRPEKVNTVRGHVDDGSQTRLYLDGVHDSDLVVKDTPENIIRKIVKFEVKRKLTLKK